MIAFVIGYLVIAWLIKYISANSYMPFVIYRIVLGFVVIGLCAAGVLTTPPRPGDRERAASVAPDLDVAATRVGGEPTGSARPVDTDVDARRLPGEPVHRHRRDRLVLQVEARPRPCSEVRGITASRPRRARRSCESRSVDLRQAHRDRVGVPTAVVVAVPVEVLRLGGVADLGREPLPVRVTRRTVTDSPNSSRNLTGTCSGSAGR